MSKRKKEADNSNPAWMTFNCDEYQLCDCNWLDKNTESEQMCGCGEKHCRLYRDEVIHWLGKHWTLDCAFKHAVALLKQKNEK
jgi:hypothetical protein